MNNIKVVDLLATQRTLKRRGLIDEMITTLYCGGTLPPVSLKSPSDGLYIVNDGHHRVAAIVLSGRDVLYPEEYEMTYEPDYRRPVLGKMTDLINKVMDKQQVVAIM